MNWLEQLAPTIFSALGGPLAGLAYEAVSKALNIEPEAAKTILESAKLSSDQIVQLKLAEIELRKQADQLGLNFETLAVDDRKSAREMEMVVHSVWPGILSAITTLAVLGVIAAHMSGANIPNDPVTIQLIGSLTTGWGMALAYWFGTTRSSMEKDKLIHKSTPL